MAVNSFEDLKMHAGHNIECAIYSDIKAKEDISVSLECIDCNEVLLSFDVDENYDPKIYVWHLVITFVNVSCTNVYASEGLAREALYNFVQEHWQGESLGDLPLDRDSAVATYFDSTEEASYTLHETALISF